MPRRLFQTLALALCATGCVPQVQPVEPTYDAIASAVFQGCSTRSCHSDFSAKGGLVLTPEKAYDQLVNVPAEDANAKAKGKLRVVPGNPEASFLFQKITEPAVDEGDRMPQRLPKLQDDHIAAIRSWIANGAKRESPSSGLPTMP